jgi:hypothetical protein
VYAFTLPSVVVVVNITAAPQAECSVIECVVIVCCIVTVRKVYAIVCSTITVIAYGCAVVEVVTVIVVCIDTHSPTISYHIDRAIEVIAVDESTILATTQYIHEIFVTHIEQIIVVVYSIIVSVYYIVNDLIGIVKEVEVNLIHIFILAIAES